MSVPTLYTDRLVLRPWTENDTDALHRLWTDADVRRYLFDDMMTELHQTADLVRSSIEASSRTGLGFWGISLHSNAPLLGFCGFRHSEDIQGFELMYGLLPQCWGQGLATEACLGALSYFWTATSHRQVYARTDSPNQRSVALIQRLGMQQMEMQRGPQGQALLTYVLNRPCRQMS
jgi:RimJ/RimL family protein N-acetyltransferase